MPASDLANLPEVVGGWFSGIPAASDALIRDSALACRPGSFPNLLVATDIRFSLRFYISKSESRVVFFFFREDLPDAIRLDARFTFTVGTSFNPAPPPPPGLDAITYTLSVPSFLIPKPDAPALAQLGWSDSSRRNTLLVDLDGSILAIKDPDRGAARARFKVTSGSLSDVISLRRSGAWPLQPFLSALRAVADWTASSAGPNRSFAMAPPNPADTSDSSRLLLDIVRAYLVARSSLVASFPGRDPLRSSLVPSHTLLAFASDLTLRLNKDGRFATGDENPFQLRLTIEATHEAPTHLRLTLGVPDFLVSGDLHRRFLATLRTPEALESLADAFDDDVTASELEAFIRRSEPGALVFRIERSSHSDTDVIIIEGVLGTRPVIAVIEADFTVDTTADDPATLDVGSLECVYIDPNDPNAELESDVVEYLLRLFSSLLDWIGTLP